MIRGLIVLVTAATVAAAVTPAQAGGNGGAVAAGVIGGLAAGAIIGSAVAQPRYYAPAPAYAPPPPGPCYWTRGEAVWDGYRWVRPRITRALSFLRFLRCCAPAHSPYSPREF